MYIHVWHSYLIVIVIVNSCITAQVSIITDKSAEKQIYVDMIRKAGEVNA